MATFARSAVALGLTAAGVGLLVFLSLQTPAGPQPRTRPAPPGPAVAAAVPREDPSPPPVPPSPSGAVSMVLLVPAGAAGPPPDLVLGAAGGWEHPQTRGAVGDDGGGGRLVVGLPGGLATLPPSARASLVALLENLAGTPAVVLPPWTSAAEERELERLLRWVR